MDMDSANESFGPLKCVVSKTSHGLGLDHDGSHTIKGGHITIMVKLTPFPLAIKSQVVRSARLVIGVTN